MRHSHYWPKKQYSQNFLCDSVIINNIINLINPQKKDHLIEIGGGEGALTEHLAQNCKTLTVIEIDQQLCTYLTKKFNHLSHVNILCLDILNYDFSNAENKNRIIGNLPYHISTAIISKLLINHPKIIDATLMLQQEVAQRIVAKKGKKRSWQSVITERLSDADLLLDIPPESFYPIPKVHSSIIQIRFKQQITNSIQLEKFIKTVKIAFTNKRKNLKNNFKDHLSLEQWQSININSQLRAEQLSVNDFEKINFLLNP